MLMTRITRLIRPLLLLQICGFLFFVAGTHGAFAPMPNPPTTTDFSSFYAAGRLADQGRAAQAYQEAPLYATEQQVIAPGIRFNKFLNPPVFLLLCAPLAWLPYLVAFILFEAVSALIWLMVVTRIAGGGRLAAMALACVPSVWWALGWGQNSFLSAALMGLGTLLLARRPALAGAAFGALIFKPHFGILIPVALLAGRQWRAIGGATLSVVALAGLSWACFGSESWLAFFAMARHAGDSIQSGRILLKAHVDLAGTLWLLGVPTRLGWAAQGLASLLTAGTVAWLWRNGDERRYAVRQAALVAGTLMAMPFLLFYDLVMASVAAAWLARAARRDGWRTGEIVTLAGLLLVDLGDFPSASWLHLAIGVCVGPVLVWLAIARWRGACGLEQSEPESQN